LDASGAVINSFAAPDYVPGPGPQGLAEGPTSIFYINGAFAGPHTLYELDPVTGAVIDSDVLPSTPDIAGLGYLNGLVYVQIYTTDQILVFDPVSDTVVQTLNIGADIVGGLTGAADLGLLFASNFNGDIFAINPTTGAVVNAFHPGVGPLHGGLAYYHGELIASNYADPATGYRIDPDTGAVLGSI